MIDSDFPCVYLIVNLINGHAYVGSTARYGRRVAVHKANLKAGKHSSSYLQRAYNKHGSEAFAFVVLERVDTADLTAREAFWMERLKPEYNLAPVAGSCLGVKHTAEARRRMSEIAIRVGADSEERARRSERARRQHAEGRFGEHYEMTPEIRARIGRPGHPATYRPTHEQARRASLARRTVGSRWGTFTRKGAKA
jgi:group I intron endonuclease